MLWFLCSLLAGVALADAPVDAGRGLRLPLLVQQLRGSLPEEDVQELLDVSREAGLDSAEAFDLFWQVTASSRAYGPMDGLAPFVATLLRRGLRGEALGTELIGEHERLRGQRRTGWMGAPR